MLNFLNLSSRRPVVATGTFLLAVACAWQGANAQQAANPGVATGLVACPRAQDVGPQHLYGLWQADIYDKALPDDVRLPPQHAASGKATLLFERHPEHADSLRGTLKLSDAKQGHDLKGWLSGDIEDGELVMDESENGQSISAVWVGQVVGPSCGKEIRGTRRLAGEDEGQFVVLKKVPGWR